MISGVPPTQYFPRFITRDDLCQRGAGQHSRPRRSNGFRPIASLERLVGSAGYPAVSAMLKIIEFRVLQVTVDRQERGRR
jgi:hypothetical protein